MTIEGRNDIDDRNLLSSGALPFRHNKGMVKDLLVVICDQCDDVVDMDEYRIDPKANSQLRV